MGNVRERRGSREGQKTQSKRWPRVVYLGDKQKQSPVAIWGLTCLCKIKPSGFHMETGARDLLACSWQEVRPDRSCRAAVSPPKLASMMGAVPRGAAGCSYAPFIVRVRLFLRRAQESSALQLCNEPLPFFLFLGSEFLFSSSSTSKKRIFNNLDRKSLLS